MELLPPLYIKIYFISFQNKQKEEFSLFNEEPDVPLREPLDFDYRLNRKMAKQLYNTEKYSKIKENKEKLKQDKEKTI